MDQKNKKNNRSNKNGSNLRGVVSLVGWALLLTIIISYAGNYFGSTGNRSSTVTLEYSDFVELVENRQVESVDFDNSEEILLITPKDGYVYTDDKGVAYTKGEDGYTLPPPAAGRRPWAWSSSP